MFDDLRKFNTDVIALCRGILDVCRSLDVARDGFREAQDEPDGETRALQARDVASAALARRSELRTLLDSVRDSKELCWFDEAFSHSTLRGIAYDEAFGRTLQLGWYREDDTGRIDGRWLSIHGMAIGRAAKWLESGFLEHLASFKSESEFAGEFPGEIDEQLVDDLRLAALETIEYRHNGHALSLSHADSSEQSSLDDDEVAADHPKKWTIPAEHRLGPVRKKELLAALKISYATLSRRVEAGIIHCDQVMRQSYYVDAREFSKDEQGRLQYRQPRE